MIRRLFVAATWPLRRRRVADVIAAAEWLTVHGLETDA
jgi:hypothetical protein